MLPSLSLLKMPREEETPPHQNSISLLSFPHSWNIHGMLYILVFTVLVAIDLDVGRLEGGRQILEGCYEPLRHYSGLSLRLSSLLQRHNPLP